MMTQAHYQQPPTDTQPVRGYDMTCQFYFPFPRVKGKAIRSLIIYVILRSIDPRFGV